jgi:hypothetical protein
LRNDRKVSDADIARFTFDEVFTQPLSSLPAELRGPVGTDAIADGENHGEIVVKRPVIFYHQPQLSSIP